MREFSVLIRREVGLEGQWVSHCLNWDLVSQGDSPAHALRMIAEAVIATISGDVADALDPDDRPAAPTELWDSFRAVLQNGTRISAADVDTLAKQLGQTVIAAVMYLQAPRLTDANNALATAPPPFMIAALQPVDPRTNP